VLIGGFELRCAVRSVTTTAAFTFEKVTEFFT
jgi:hypothetical protein